VNWKIKTIIKGTSNIIYSSFFPRWSASRELAHLAETWAAFSSLFGYVTCNSSLVFCFELLLVVCSPTFPVLTGKKKKKEKRK
jgi:hypothetical protein